MEIIKECITGAIVAVLTTIFIFLFQNYIHPFVLGIVQRAPNISGVWNGFNIDKQAEEFPYGKMIIKQVGSSINALLTRQTSNGLERKFNCKGTISSGQVLLIWKEEESNGYNMGTITLQLTSNLQELKGIRTYYHKDVGRVISKEMVYKKLHK